MAWTLGQIAEHVGGIVIGDKGFQVDSIATLQNAEKNQLSFLANAKYKKYLASTAAGAVIVNSKTDLTIPFHAIVVDDPYLAYAKATGLLNPVKRQQRGIHASSSIDADSFIHSSATIGAHVVIESGVDIGKDVVIGHGCVIQQGVRIAIGSRLNANVIVCKCVKIGENSLIHAGAVIGSDGFGFADDNGKWIKVPQIGSVRIGGNVEIGANTTIDRGTLEDTIIGNGVKLDNQIQLAHNTIIGDDTVIAACVGIAGSTRIGKRCVIGGRVGIAGHLTIVDSVQITGMSMVTKSIKKAGIYSSGIPAEPNQLWRKNVARYRQMHRLIDKVKALEKLIK